MVCCFSRKKSRKLLADLGAGHHENGWRGDAEGGDVTASRRKVKNQRFCKVPLFYCSRCHSSSVGWQALLLSPNETHSMTDGDLKVLLGTTIKSKRSRLRHFAGGTGRSRGAAPHLCIRRRAGHAQCVPHQHRKARSAGALGVAALRAGGGCGKAPGAIGYSVGGGRPNDIGLTRRAFKRSIQTRFTWCSGRDVALRFSFRAWPVCRSRGQTAARHDPARFELRTRRVCRCCARFAPTNARGISRWWCSRLRSWRATTWNAARDHVLHREAGGFPKLQRGDAAI